MNQPKPPSTRRFSWTILLFSLLSLLLLVAWIKSLLQPESVPKGTEPITWLITSLISAAIAIIRGLVRRRIRSQQAQTYQAAYEPHLTRAQQLLNLGFIEAAQLREWEEYPRQPHKSLGVLISQINKAEQVGKRRQEMIEKYGSQVGLQVLEKQVVPGMSREQLWDAFGEPTKIEKELAGTLRETLIYGNKSSGSYFHVEDGIITKAVIR